MLKNLLLIMKNRAKIGAVNFLLELTIGVLTEWQRSNRAGSLDVGANFGEKNVSPENGGVSHDFFKFNKTN